MIFCQICCEPFHSFCLSPEERPLKDNKENWCCRRCKFCHVCGRRSKNTKVCFSCWWVTRSFTPLLLYITLVSIVYYDHCTHCSCVSFISPLNKCFQKVQLIFTAEGFYICFCLASRGCIIISLASVFLESYFTLCNFARCNFSSPCCSADDAKPPTTLPA